MGAVKLSTARIRGPDLRRNNNGDAGLRAKSDREERRCKRSKFVGEGISQSSQRSFVSLREKPAASYLVLRSVVKIRRSKL